MSRRRKEHVWNEFLDCYEKECARCHEMWPADEEFYNKARSKIDGLTSYCRACIAEKRRHYSMRISKMKGEQHEACIS